MDRQSTLYYQKVILPRCIKIGQYIVSQRATLRATALAFGVSKSTVHQAIGVLKHIEPSLHQQALAVIQYNKSVRHLRGGEGTRKRYEQIRQARQLEQILKSPRIYG